MSQLTLKLPETLHHQLKTLAQKEGISLNQYILFALTRQTTLSYKTYKVPESEIAKQRTDFTTLLDSLGEATFSEIEQVMHEREVVHPEPGLTPEIIKRLQDRIANQQSLI